MPIKFRLMVKLGLTPNILTGNHLAFALGTVAGRITKDFAERPIPADQVFVVEDLNGDVVGIATTQEVEEWP